MNALARRAPNLRFIGVGGDQMIDQGLESLAAIEELSVNGFIEPLKRLPSLVRIISRLFRCFRKVDVVVGNSDIMRIRSANSSYGILKDCRVLIVLD